MDDLGTDNLLMQVMAELEVVAQRKRDLEGFVRIYTEFRRIGRTNALSQIQVPADRPAATSLQVEDAGRLNAGSARPGVVLADPDLSLVDAAAKVLRYFGEPMKARRIAETMLAWGYPYSKGVDELRASVGGVLARAVREQDGTFTKLETRGVFGLREWGMSDSAVQSSRAAEGGESEDLEGATADASESSFTRAGDVEMD